MKPTPFLCVEQDADTLILTPQRDLGELNFAQIEEGAQDVLRLLNDNSVKHIVLDFHKTDAYGSSALGFFLKLWKRVRTRNGQLAFCNVSPHELEILKLTRLDHVWAVCPNRAAALAAVHAGDH